MTQTNNTSVHASAVKVGSSAILIRGPSGSGKSQLAFDLILSGRSGQLPPAVLVGDDRVYLDTADGELWVRPAPELIGLIEIRGLGIRQCPFVEAAVVRLVVDLGAVEAARMPSPDALRTTISGVLIPRIPVGPEFSPFRMVAAALMTAESSPGVKLSAHCSKGIGNHITPTIATE